MNLRKECEGAKRIGISGHIRPDGDCVGACLALSLYLKKMMEAAEVKVFLEEPSSVFESLKGFEEIDSSFPDEEPFDVFFVVDTVPDSIGEAEKY